MKFSSRTRKTSVNLSDSISRQLNMYALAAGAAGVGLLASTPPAAAKIVYTPAHVKILFGDIVPLDLNHDGVKDFSFSNQFESGQSGGVNFLRVSGANSENLPVGSGTYAYALRAGVRVGPQNKFGGLSMADWFYFHTSNGRTSSGYGFQWANGGKGVMNRYLGLRFVIKGKIHFGWARLNVTFKKDSHGQPRVVGLLTGYAYETISNRSIIAGKTKGPDDGVEESNAGLTAPTPEPATLGVLAMGSPALSIWR
jgi:hypothetical protein